MITHLCPRCGCKTVPRTGVHFDHESRCPECDWSGTYEEALQEVKVTPPKWARNMSEEQLRKMADVEDKIPGGLIAGYAPPRPLTKQCIVVRKDLDMDFGKLWAQICHATMAFMTQKENLYLIHRLSEDGSSIDPPERWLRVRLSDAEYDWMHNSYTKVLLECYSEEELRELVDKAVADEIKVTPIVDNGTTVFGKPTLTCAAFGPDFVHRLDPHLRHLKLYTTKPYKPKMEIHGIPVKPVPPDIVTLMEGDTSVDRMEAWCDDAKTR